MKAVSSWWRSWKRGAALLASVGFGGVVACVPAMILLAAMGRPSWHGGPGDWVRDPVFIVVALACVPAYVGAVAMEALGLD